MEARLAVTGQTGVTAGIHDLSTVVSPPLKLTGLSGGQVPPAHLMGAATRYRLPHTPALQSLLRWCPREEAVYHGTLYVGEGRT